MGDVEKSLAERRIRKLEKLGVVRRIRSPLLTVSPIALTRQGCDLIGDSLPPLSHVRIGQFAHDVTLTDLAFDLLKRFGPNCTWISERRLRQMYPDAEHIADGILRRAGAADTAVELELTAKSPKRVEAILAEHAANLAYQQVWYFTDNEEVARLVRRLAGEYPQVRVVRFNRRIPHG